MTDPAETGAAQRAVEAALKALRDMTDPQERLEAATRLYAMTREWSGEAAAVRHDSAAEILERDKLSLAQLARRVGISRQRAGQMIDAARKKDGEQDAGADDGTG